jgi:hypothetical protein
MDGEYIVRSGYHFAKEGWLGMKEAHLTHPICPNYGELYGT